MDTENIPSPLNKPSRNSLSPNPARAVVVFDLETTSLDRHAQITQIATQVYDDSTKSYSQFMIPTKPIAPAASSVTGLSVVVHEGIWKLAANGALVNACSQVEDLKGFVLWLQSMGKSVILVAHNGYSYDMCVLYNAMRREGLLEDPQE